MDVSCSAFAGQLFLCLFLKNEAGPMAGFQVVYE